MTGEQLEAASAVFLLPLDKMSLRLKNILKFN